MNCIRKVWRKQRDNQKLLIEWHTLLRQERKTNTGQQNRTQNNTDWATQRVQCTPQQYKGEFRKENIVSPPPMELLQISAVSSITIFVSSDEHTGNSKLCMLTTSRQHILVLLPPADNTIKKSRNVLTFPKSSRKRQNRYS